MAEDDEVCRSLVYTSLQKDSSWPICVTDLDQMNQRLVIDILMTDYVMKRISRIGYPDLDLFPRLVGRYATHPLLTEIMAKLLAKGDEFEKQYYPRFENRKSLLEKIPERAFIDFNDTIYGVFEDNKVNWGRLIGFLSFTGSYCCACLERGMARIVPSLVEYAVKFMLQNMENWILSTGGWCAFAKALETENFTIKVL